MSLCNYVMPPCIIMYNLRAAYYMHVMPRVGYHIACLFALLAAWRRVYVSVISMVPTEGVWLSEVARGSQICTSVSVANSAVDNISEASNNSHS